KQCARIVYGEIGVHLECKFSDAMVAREFRGFFPVGDDLFFPLPLESLGELRWPAISNPTGILIGRRSARTTRKTHDHRNSKLLGKLDSLAESLCVSRSNGGIGMHRIAVAA